MGGCRGMVMGGCTGLVMGGCRGVVMGVECVSHMKIQYKLTCSIAVYCIAVHF